MVIELNNNRHDYIALADEPDIRADLTRVILSIPGILEYIYDI